MSAKHSGWYDDDGDIKDEEGRFVCHMAQYSGLGDRPEGDGTIGGLLNFGHDKELAGLIAAAPEMLARLREAREVLSAHWFRVVDSGDGCAEEYNNDDVIELDSKIAALVASIDGKPAE